MENVFVGYVHTYGYLVIFIFCFFSEIGIPVSFPNELVIIISGSLVATGVLSPYILVPLLFVADFGGTSIFYWIFYSFGEKVFTKLPAWMGASEESFRRIRAKIERAGKGEIFLGRFIPYLRGYITAGSGFFKVSPKIFFPQALTAALIRGAILLAIGYALNDQIVDWVQAVGVQNIILVAFLATTSVFSIRIYLRYRKAKRMKGM